MEQYKGKALGVYEVDNLVAAYVALDAAPISNPSEETRRMIEESRKKK